MKTPGLTLILFALLANFSLPAQTSSGTDAEALLAKLDGNQLTTTAHSLGTIKVEDRFGSKESGFESWSQGADKSLIVFSSGEEKGQKILRLGDTLYVSYPEADKAVRIQGAALRDSIAGSDLSYEDMTGERGFAPRYSAKIAGQAEIAGEACIILELSAKKPGLAYPYLKIWVSSQDFSGRKTEEYALNKRLLKTQEVLAVKTVAGKVVPVQLRMIDHLKGKSQTLITLTVVELDRPVGATRFSLAELTW